MNIAKFYDGPLERFAALYGREWRAELRNAWRLDSRDPRTSIEDWDALVEFRDRVGDHLDSIHTDAEWTEIAQENPTP